MFLWVQGSASPLCIVSHTHTHTHTHTHVCVPTRAHTTEGRDRESRMHRANQKERESVSVWSINRTLFPV